ncbi:hypothetical protein G3A_07875 [Bacillus sp. 17376]|nr:hypothetical protein G3A_07875 [Bacillus sp. 17376]
MREKKLEISLKVNKHGEVSAGIEVKMELRRSDVLARD